jgi:ribosomal protein S18 acetylase RimI-like enzyme
MATDEPFRPARREDAAQIASLIRAAFEPQVLDLFIYGCSGIERFVALQIDATKLGGDSAYFVVETKGRVIACIELRRRSTSLFLNYVAVDPAHRGRGYGNRLLHFAITQIGTARQRTLDLDVIDSNVAARAWYDSLGMDLGTRTGWFRLDLPPNTTGAERVEITGFPQAMICQDALGFSQLGLASPHGTYAVGLLGRSWFRATERDIIDDPDALAALRLFDASRSLLLLAPVEAMHGHQPIIVTQRRSIELATMLERSSAT